MKGKVLYIENNPADIEAITKLLENDYEVIPGTKEDIDSMLDMITKGKITEYVQNVIEKEYYFLRLIICDLELIDGDKSGGSKLIKFIRNDIEISEMRLVPRLIPIMALTNYSSDISAQEALDNGAIQNINKKDIHKNWFLTIIKSMINYYRQAYLERTFDDLKDGYEDIRDRLEMQNELIISGFDNLSISIRGSQEEILYKFDLLFNILFSSFKKDTQQKIFHSFKSELETVLPQELKENIEQNTWDKIKVAIKEVNKGGGFKEFVDSTYDILNEAEILEGKGKLIGITIKSMFRIMSS